MTRGGCALARAAAALAAALACAVLFADWLAPDNVLALWPLVAFCR
jgi:hypothetical protein